MNEWYQQLNKPTWAPKEQVFGIVWSLLYPIIIGVNIFVTLQFIRHKLPLWAVLPFWLNVGFNIIFTPIQFGLKNNALAFACILAVLLTIGWAMVAVWPHYKWVTLAFVPYLIWVSIATVLQFQIMIKN